MNFTFSRNVSLAVFAAFLLGGGLYLANRQRHKALPLQHAAEAKAAIATEDPGRDPNESNSNHQAAPTGPDREAVVAAAKRPNAFGLSGVVELADVPVGRFRDELSRLSETARRHALDQLEELRVPLNDVASLSADRDGWLFYQCHPRLPPPVASLSEHNEALAGLPGAPVIVEAAAEVPINAPPVRHSRPGATKVIYLDFNGHSISGSAWNNEKGDPGDENYRPAVATYEAKPFNADGNPSSFSDAEQAVILRVWERVAEDYRGFDVDVTTEEPATFNANTGRILITDNVDANGVNMPSSTGSGVAYFDVFGRANYASYYSPALVYANQDYNYASYIAETASHEMGHNLSLSHDGTTSGDEYYNGHGTGDTSWNTIMGGAFTEHVTQWSKGEYFSANNLEDDLAIIAGHLGYVPDDHADSNGSATPLVVGGLSVSGAGVISQTGEADRFSFESGAGAITLSATTFRSASQSHGGNLDVALELYDVGGSLVASANVDGVTDATLNATVVGGTYFLRVFGAGSGLPMNYSPSGYTNYGSLGQYTISGTIVSTAPVAPIVTSQPASLTVNAGQTTRFTVGASGYPAPSFQWKKEGVDIGGATASTYSIAATVMDDAGSYTCVVTNSAGAATSNVAILTVQATPVFTSQPISQVVAFGSAVMFTATASGNPAPTYQWQKDGMDIFGATNTTYAVGNASFGHAGSYGVVARNAAGSATSNLAGLTVFVVPTISLQPVAQTIPAGTPVSFFVMASGFPAPTFQWQKDGVNISGATNSTYAIASSAPQDASNYSVVVTNPYGSVVSTGAILSINAANSPYFTIQPASQVVTSGTAVTFTAAAVGIPSPTYQWRKDGVDVGGATAATYGLASVVAGDAGNYEVMATNSAGWAVSRSAALVVKNPIYTFATLAASTGSNPYVDGIGSAAHVVGPQSIAVDATGNLYISDFLGRTVRKIAVDGTGTTLAGRTGRAGSIDGVGSSARFGGPVGIAVDQVGNVYVADAGNEVVRKITPNGTVTTLAGTPGAIGSADGTGPTAQFRDVDGVAVDAGGNVYVADSSNHTIRKITPDGTVTTFAGTAGVAGAVDGTGTAARFSYPRGVAVDGTGNIYVSDFGNHAIRRITPGGVVTTLAGGTFGFADGTGGAAQFGGNYALAVDGSGNVFVADSTYNTIRRVSPGGAVMTIAGTPGVVGAADGTGGNVQFNAPYGVAVDRVGGIYVADMNNNTIRWGALTAPVLTSPISAEGNLGQDFAQTVTFSGALSHYSASGLPTGLTINYTTGVIGGTPTVLGYFPVILSATNGAGTGYAALNLTINPAAFVPAITLQPSSQVASFGSAVQFSAAAYGYPAPTYQWQKNGVDIAGATGASYTITGIGAGDVASYAFVATNVAGSATSNSATLTLGTIPPGFDVQGYLTRNPDMAALYGANSYAAWQHYHDVGIYQGEVFDDLFRVEEYLALYPELFALFGSNLSAVLDHWLSTGRIEGKLGRIPLEFSAQGYFTRNPDVAIAVGNNPILAWGHYWAYGIYEGRAYDNELRVFEYLAINADLTAAFVNDWRTAALHWMRYGRTEGRLGRLPLTFSVATYLSRNPDVAAVWGTDPTTVFLHFWLYGISEARTYDDLFRVDDYLALNPDLAATFGTDRRGAFKHWVRYGQSEGRPAKNP